MAFPAMLGSTRQRQHEQPGHQSPPLAEDWRAGGLLVSVMAAFPRT
jgi:hypothetical protein